MELIHFYLRLLLLTLTLINITANKSIRAKKILPYLFQDSGNELANLEEQPIAQCQTQTENSGIELQQQEALDGAINSWNNMMVDSQSLQMGQEGGGSNSAVDRACIEQQSAQAEKFGTTSSDELISDDGLSMDYSKSVIGNKKSTWQLLDSRGQQRQQQQQKEEEVMREQQVPVMIDTDQQQIDIKGNKHIQQQQQQKEQQTEDSSQQQQVEDNSQQNVDSDLIAIESPKLMEIRSTSGLTGDSPTGAVAADPMLTSRRWKSGSRAPRFLGFGQVTRNKPVNGRTQARLSCRFGNSTNGNLKISNVEWTKFVGDYNFNQQQDNLTFECPQEHSMCNTVPIQTDISTTIHTRPKGQSYSLTLHEVGKKQVGLYRCSALRQSGRKAPELVYRVIQLE